MKKLRIGVDARLLSEPITGIGRYTYEVLSRMVGMGHHWILYSHRTLVIGEWDQKNVEVRTMNLSGRILRMLWAQTILPFQAKRDGIDIFWSPAHRIPALLSANIHSVVTIHDLVWKHAPHTMRPLSRLLDSWLMPAAIRQADRVIAVSQHTESDILAEVLEATGKTYSIPLGVSVPGISMELPINPLTKLGIKYFLFVGTLEPRKNLARLLHAFSIIPLHLKGGVKVAIVGGKGWGGIDLNQLILKFGLQQSVVVLGYVSDEQLHALYSGAIFLAMPSLYEGFGLPLVEAMAHGTPVLSSNVSSMVEVIDSAGILVDPLSVESIASGLIKLLNDYGLRVSLSRQGLARSKIYSWDATASKTMALFEGVVGSSMPSS